MVVLIVNLRKEFQLMLWFKDECHTQTVQQWKVWWCKLNIRFTITSYLNTFKINVHINALTAVTMRFYGWDNKQ